MTSYDVDMNAQKVLAVVANWFSKIGVGPSDNSDLRLKKTLLLGIATMVALAAFFWSAVYAWFGEYLPAAIPFSYAVVSSLSITVFILTRRYQFFRFSQLLLILVLPFLLMLSLGGFVNSSAVILWSLLCPLGALLFATPRQAVIWFGAYLGLVAASGFLQPLLRVDSSLPDPMVLFLFAMNIASVSTIAFILLNYFVRQEQQSMQLLKVEQDRSERLLLNVLPKEIAGELKEGNRLVAQQHDAASILFADIVGFTGMSERLTPCNVVELLNEVFSHFDSIVEQYGLEKIRVIGDSYMVVAGAPRERPDHAQILARLALEMKQCQCKSEAPDGNKLRFRIGINSGPVVAGIIGQSKFHYDVWSDAVNIAARMESHGIPGEIQIARPTYELIRNEFICRPRGAIVVKGKDKMETWFLDGIRDDAN
jgi:adenylate cyclase